MATSQQRVHFEEKNQTATPLQRIIQFTLCMYTHHTLPSDAIDCWRIWQETGRLFCKGVG